MKGLVPKSFASANLATSSEIDSVGLTSPGSIMEGDSLQDRSQHNMVIKSSRSVPKSQKRASDVKLSLNKINGKIMKRSSKSASVPRFNKKATKFTSLPENQPKTTVKDQQKNRSVFNEGGLPDGSELAYICRGETKLEGYKVGHKIYCFCCHDKVSPSTFEVHAGQPSRKKPYGNIFVSNGVSLHQFASSLNLNSKYLVKKLDHLCNICCKGEDRENLMYCNGCPRSFHRGCLRGQIIPPGRWYCQYCQNSTKSLEQNGNSVEARRVSGVNPIDQIANRCINIISNPDNSELVACVLCRCYDFSETGFNDRTVIVCDQCEKEFHIGCLREHNKADLQALPEGNWFCCVDCQKIHFVIKHLLTFEPENIPNSLMALIGKKQKDNNVDNINGVNMKWILLNGKNAPNESKYLLSEAVDIFHDCFDPIIDVVTGSDFVPSMAYGLKMGNLDFGGMLCAMLTIDSKVVTAGLFRVLGPEVAELPLVATSKPNQGKGYFQLFFTCFERLLSYLKVKKIVLPAAANAKPLWTKKMGFDQVTPLQLSEYKQTWTSMVSFVGTTMLERKVRVREVTLADGVDFSISMD